MDIKKDVQTQFGHNAESYVTSKIHKEGKDLKKLIEIADFTGNEKALDVATGGGHTANALAPHVHQVIAFDLTREMLEAAKRFIKENGHHNVDYVEGDAEDMPFEEKAFDIVTCRIAPHHFPHIKNFISEAFRVLKPGGQFLLDDNVVPEENDFDHFYNTIEKKRDYSHYRAWKKTEWIIMLETQGFEIQEWYRFEKTFVFDSWCRRMHLSKEEQIDLNKYIVHSNERIKQKFNIVIDGDKVKSFQGEAILLKATKKGL
ncbi:MAG: class I SAM-dependent methyltransferase [Tuberibacillus sp.]